MQQLLPSKKMMASLKNRTTFFYFFKLSKSNDNGATIQQQFAEQQAQCLVNAPTLTKGAWGGIGIMAYPNPSNLLALEKMPGYKKALVHRDAGLERTALIIAKN